MSLGCAFGRGLVYLFDGGWKQDASVDSSSRASTRRMVVGSCERMTRCENVQMKVVSAKDYIDLSSGVEVFGNCEE